MVEKWYLYCLWLQVVTEYDPEMLAGAQIPTLVVGTKLDLLRGQEPPGSYIAEDCGAEEINLDCTSNRWDSYSGIQYSGKAQSQIHVVIWNDGGGGGAAAG